ncbi:MAG: DUF4861 family protein [Paludibacteraceae bacterium]|nr:DUF4861 family protein [Paludibacteraceae bacterium]
MTHSSPLSSLAIALTTGAIACMPLLSGCRSTNQVPQPQQAGVCTSFWRRVTPADSLMPDYRVVYEGTKRRDVVPVQEWTCYPGEDSYRAFHHHGVAVESALMAYRIYFDKKHTIDVYAKRTPRLELPTSYWYPDETQLERHYGDDILRVGGTVGVGSVKPWNGSKMVHFDSVASRTQRIVSCTHDRAVMEVVVRGWKNGKQPVDCLTVRYTLEAGHRDMLCEIFCSDSVTNLCTGVQRVGQSSAHIDTYLQESKGGTVISTWGTDWPVNDTVRYAKETVGLAVCIPQAYCGEYVHDKHNHLALLQLHKHTSTMWYARFRLTVVAQKEDTPPARNEEEFRAFLKQWCMGKE